MIASDFIKNISQEKVNALCAYLESLDSTNINATTTNQIIDKTGEIIAEASKESFKSVTKTKHQNRKEKILQDVISGLTRNVLTAEGITEKQNDIITD